MRAVRAKRLAGSSPDSASGDQPTVLNEVADASREQFAGGSRSEAVEQRTSRANPTSPNPIVEAALTRVRRATKNANRAALPLMQTTRPQPSPQTTVRAEREATARALVPAEETKPLPPVRYAVQPATRGVAAAVSPAPDRQAASDSPASPDVAGPLDVIGLPSLIDDVEPADYLAAEISKVDEAMRPEFARNERASLIAHLVMNTIDLLVIAVSAAPFLALMEISNADYSVAATRVAALSVAASMAFFYLSLTQFLMGKSFGMMLTNTRIVDTRSFKHPSLLRVLVRTVGYLVAVGFGLIGLFWLLLNHRRRGWHDIASGTLVVRDF
ncbi:MAG TPA: RDD family protein [Blastocatellia bacterium]|nr:RDD family protein [Blastocatellia bacterium]